MTSQPAKQKTNRLSNIHRESESANEYDADEFEKDDIVRMAEPTKPQNIRPPKNHRSPE